CSREDILGPTSTFHYW
nr:immunoglobulin heavy chain junction region [Macaca mulatta]MOV86786.1 immunoglobulin heavy chain junction region [Macaca mulatta]MOV87079.1 immunoglobulin heavy chain junction region [Macaca mulatta]MOV88690.1 immunoglobulin heavy chain junction region [Macaca mulatta]MOV88746.1 immunoglobulin heavy chain junction region [Macaca mulatta]